MWPAGWRSAVWADLDRPYDLIVVGGGITGAGILREATRAGLRCLLLEAADYGSGTSSRSSKLVHGGLRYLRNGQIMTTISSVHERERLLRQGKGLVTPLGFVYASYERDRLPLWLFGAGLIVYDLLGLHWGHKRYDPDGLARLAPGLNQQGLRGGYRYFDAQTDDARLVLRVISEAVQEGAQALNYVAVEGLLRDSSGRVCGVAARNLAPQAEQETAEIQARVVVNATGAAADFLREQVGRQPRLRILRGSHLLFSAERVPLQRAVTFLHPGDDRPVFALPWEGVTLFGTTDVDHRTSPAGEPAISGREVDYLLTGLNYAFPDAQLSEADVQATFAGLRAVVNTGKANPSDESREHAIWEEDGLLTVTGGKLTTFRVMAQDALRSMRHALPGELHFRHRRVLAGREEVPLASEDTLSAARRLRLLGRYGRQAGALVDAAEPGETSPIATSPALWAELRWAARAEAVLHLDDLLLRRVRLGLMLPNGGLDQLAQIRAIAQSELGWDDRRWQAESAAYKRKLEQACGLPAAGWPVERG
ncbi:MAG: glycerol-3-phosphate dehydrogenase/oxidase [Candidatus Promineifilaceae bacterium]|nr:glycerol-3-phosphate dehydrogenase/oxidase [Candidatus Promineifilaceae bacterium]